jgi:hypothetical protein
VRLVEAGLEPCGITMIELEDLVVRLETAHWISEAAREHSNNDASEWSQVSDQVVNHKPNPEFEDFRFLIWGYEAHTMFVQ